MPTKSPKQRRLMQMCANDSEAAKKYGIPQHVAREFLRADERQNPKRTIVSRVMRGR